MKHHEAIKEYGDKQHNKRSTKYSYNYYNRVSRDYNNYQYIAAYNV